MPCYDEAKMDLGLVTKTIKKVILNKEVSCVVRLIYPGSTYHCVYLLSRMHFVLNYVKLNKNIRIRQRQCVHLHLQETNRYKT